MKRADTIRLFKICAWLGVALLVGVVATVRFLRIVTVTREVPMGSPSTTAPKIFVPPNEPLGELGSHCGGPLRLPCRPGLFCSIDHLVSEELGTCIKPTQATVNDSSIGQLGEACGDEPSPFVPCATGLYCVQEPKNNSCFVMDLNAPKVLSLKLEGMQFDDGTYRAKTDQTIAVHVTAMNAAQIKMRLDVAGIGKDLGLLGKSVDGSYTGKFVITPGLSGTLQIIVRDGSGNFSVLPTAVAAVD